MRRRGRRLSRRWLTLALTTDPSPDPNPHPHAWLMLTHKPRVACATPTCAPRRTDRPHVVFTFIKDHAWPLTARVPTSHTWPLAARVAPPTPNPNPNQEKKKRKMKKIRREKKRIKEEKMAKTLGAWGRETPIIKKARWAGHRSRPALMPTHGLGCPHLASPTRGHWPSAAPGRTFKPRVAYVALTTAQ